MFESDFLIFSLAILLLLLFIFLMLIFRGRYSFLYMVPIFIIIRVYIGQTYRMPSVSMLPTILKGDIIFANKYVYRFSSPNRGDLIIFRFPKDESKIFIKRVIGIPGDKIEIKEKILYLNGTNQNEPYINRGEDTIVMRTIPGRDNFDPVTVPENSYFVLGDNRDLSLDSRFWGFVESSKIIGKSIFIYSSKEADSEKATNNTL